MNKNFFFVVLFQFFLLFATPKKKTSKSKSSSRFAHWLKKPEHMLKKLVSAGKNKFDRLSNKDKISLGFGNDEKKPSVLPESFAKETNDSK